MFAMMCPCCQRELRVYREILPQQSKCRYCGAIFPAGAEKQQLRDRPAVLPNPKIEITTKPSLTPRPAIAAMGASPGPIGVTKNPAIAKRPDATPGETPASETKTSTKPRQAAMIAVVAGVIVAVALLVVALAWLLI